MKNKVQSYRLKKNMTQSELAEKAGLSLRTIQRIEAGKAPKNFTLKSIAGVFGVKPENLTQDDETNIDFNRIKLINLSALSFFIIPFGNIILPAILTYKSKDEKVKSFGKDIISLQIIWSIVTSVLMIISPFLEHLISWKIPLFIIILVLLISINTFLIIKNGMHLTKHLKLYINLKINIL